MFRKGHSRANGKGCGKALLSPNIRWMIQIPRLFSLQLGSMRSGVNPLGPKILILRSSQVQVNRSVGQLRPDATRQKMTRLLRAIVTDGSSLASYVQWTCHLPGAGSGSVATTREFVGAIDCPVASDAWSELGCSDCCTPCAAVLLFLPPLVWLLLLLELVIGRLGKQTAPETTI